MLTLAFKHSFRNNQFRHCGPTHKEREIQTISRNTTTETYRNLGFSLNHRPKEAAAPQFTDHRRCPLSSHKCHNYAKVEGRPVINPGRKQREAS
ncbi:hypothetical protein TNCT_609801 [Trichonephila clavata]|uniref:Uncharacterized protein n=1 Tax=Trichonephila clavata TaxID=2740835 RepID=A0A8X6KVV4_TRICU|nr:hypothetical protein TNCT_609801 [Trichonephila clavata]